MDSQDYATKNKTKSQFLNLKTQNGGKKAPKSQKQKK